MPRLSGVTIGGYHCERDLSCYLAKRVINPPELQKNQIQIPGKFGIDDFTDALIGTPVFSNRIIRLELLSTLAFEEWPDTYSTILNNLHGKVVDVVFDEDSEYFYNGRCEVLSAEYDKGAFRYVIEVDCGPFKRKITPAEIGSGVKPNISSTQVTIPYYGTTTIYLANETTKSITLSTPSVLTFWTTGGQLSDSMSVECGDYIFSFPNTATSIGVHSTNVLLQPGTYTLKFKQANVKAQYTNFYVHVGRWEAKL